MNNKEIFNLNLQAIISLKQLEGNASGLTSAQILEARNNISAYSGFGGCAKAFYRNNNDTGAYKGWEEEAQLLKDVTTNVEYQELRKSTQNAFYTPELITDKIYSQITSLGINSKDLEIFEPGCGTGNFLSLMPNDFSFKSYTGIELDSITARVATQLYKDEEYISILNADFEHCSEDRKYDLIVGNPPFGDNKIDGQSIHNFFIEKSIRMLKPGGILAFVVTHSFLDSQRQDARNSIFEKSNLIGVERLNQKAFIHTGTDVNTDIVYFQRLSVAQESLRAEALSVQIDSRSEEQELALFNGKAWLKAGYKDISEVSVNIGSFSKNGLRKNGENLIKDFFAKGKADELESQLFEIAVNNIKDKYLEQVPALSP